METSLKLLLQTRIGSFASLVGDPNEPLEHGFEFILEIVAELNGGKGFIAPVVRLPIQTRRHIYVWRLASPKLKIERLLKLITNRAFITTIGVVKSEIESAVVVPFEAETDFESLLFQKRIG